VSAVFPLLILLAAGPKPIRSKAWLSTEELFRWPANFFGGDQIFGVWKVSLETARHLVENA
jgi:hypothetical protein